MKAVANKDGDWLSKLTTELCPICCSVSKGGHRRLQPSSTIKEHLLLSLGDNRQATNEKGGGGGGGGGKETFLLCSNRDAKTCKLDSDSLFTKARRSKRSYF